MSADTADRLRALARDHLEGRSNLQAYRRLRAQLLDSLIAPPSGAPPGATQPRAATRPEVTQPRASTPPRVVTSAAATPVAVTPVAVTPVAVTPVAVTPVAVTRASAPNPAPALSPVAATSLPRAPSPLSAAPPPDPPFDRKVGPGPVTGYAAVALLLAVAAAFFVWRHQSRSPAPPPTAGSTSTPTSAATERTDPIRALLEPLLENPDWSNSRVLSLNEALLEAGQAQIDASRSTDWFQAFVESVRNRLREQQALAGAPLTPASSPLAALAVTLGIDLATPTQPAQVAAGAAEPHTAHAESSPHPTKTLVSEGNRARATGVHEAQAAAGPPAKAKSSAPARTGPAGTTLASVQARQASPGTASATSASAATTSPSQLPKTAVHREHPACSAALSQVRLNYCQDFLGSGDPAPLLAVLPRGSFMMGNSESPAESPVHRVTLSYGFAMSVYEVSQSEFQLYCRAAGKVCPQQPWTRGDDPVVNISWDDARDYAQWLSQATHQRYRLPTEAEWEYAARAGQTGLYPSGNTLSPTDAYFSIGATLTAPAPRSMRFNANAWHLMHMIGNAREWVEDGWNPTFDGAPVDGSAREEGKSGIKVVRGGCYADPAIRLRLTTREPLAADTRDSCTGIRLVREIH